MSGSSLSYLHPIAGLGLCMLWLGKGEWPSRGVALGWVALPAALNSLVWAMGSRAFGWTFGGLGAWIAFFFVLPFNGLLFGACVPPLLHRYCGALKSRPAEFFAGAGIELLLLFLGLGIASQFSLYVRDLQP